MDYANGKIYTIRSFQTDKFYIGSTTSTLTKRLSGHKAGYKKERPCASSEIIKYGDAYIELLEDFPCFKRDQLCKREGQLIREHKDNCVNKCIAGRTIKEYREDNKERIIQQNKTRCLKYYETNKERVLEQQKQYYEDNREHRLEYQREYKQRKKQEEIQI